MMDFVHRHKKNGFCSPGGVQKFNTQSDQQQQKSCKGKLFSFLNLLLSLAWGARGRWFCLLHRSIIFKVV